MLSHSELTEKYLTAKQAVISAGYGGEIGWQESVLSTPLTERRFLFESAWVVLNAGMRETVVRRVFPIIADGFGGFASAEAAHRERHRGRIKAMSVFRHQGKINAIVQIIDHLNTSGLDRVRERLRWEGISYLQELPYIGPITAFHLAKNLGLDVAKPDRHLTRIAAATGFVDAHHLCNELKRIVGEPSAVADIVLWRFATLFSDYEEWFQSSSLDESTEVAGGALVA